MISLLSNIAVIATYIPIAFILLFIGFTLIIAMILALAIYIRAILTLIEYLKKSVHSKLYKNIYK